MYNKSLHIHFIGIGGIGMSGIATILKSQGYTVSGCDNNIKQKTVQKLLKLGCNIYKGNNSNQCRNDTIDIVVYSTAINQQSHEIKWARKQHKFVVHRSLILAELMKQKHAIAVSGSHGKTTISAMISHILFEAGLDPSIIIGGYLKSIDNNAYHGKGSFLVAEADESDKSIENLNASMALINNVDFEHLETYTDINDVKKTFTRFINKLPFYAPVFLCHDNVEVASLRNSISHQVVTYGLSNQADIYATDIIQEKSRSIFLVREKNKQPTHNNFILNLIGKHNIQNALGAIAVCLSTGISLDNCQNALSSFTGVERRFSFCGKTKNGAFIFDDYGHHPHEISKVIEMAKIKKENNKFIMVFQPHRFTRTKGLWNQFIEVLSDPTIDHLVITDIYPASEQPIKNITSKNFVKELQQTRTKLTEYVPKDNACKELQQRIKKVTKKDDILLLQGAGNIDFMIDLL